MKAVYCNGYGRDEALEFKELERQELSENEVEVDIRYSSVTTGDWRIKSLEIPFGFKFITRLFFGFNKPKQPVFGTEYSGFVSRVGRSVEEFSVGDRVMGMTGMKMGAHCEFINIHKDDAIFTISENLSLKEAATISFGFVTAYDFLVNRANIQEGDRVLINGASGCVGSALVQLAYLYGAEVTAVCSEENFELVKSLGATNCIDYNKNNIVHCGETFDIIADTVGIIHYKDVKKILSKRGKLLLISGSLVDILTIPLYNTFSSQKVFSGPASEDKSILRKVLSLATQKKITSVVGEEVALKDIDEAYRIIEKRHKRGSLALRVKDI